MKRALLYTLAGSFLLFAIPIRADLPTKRVLTLDVAKKIAAASEAEAKRRGSTVVIVVVDDGSTDGSGEIIRKYERAVSCWIRQENQGLYAALNAGFARASGEIVPGMGKSGQPTSTRKGLTQRRQGAKTSLCALASLREPH